MWNFRARPGDRAAQAQAEFPVDLQQVRVLQDLAQTASELAGVDGVLWAPLFGDPAGRFGYEYLERVHGTISVGANEVQRDTIARLGLGMR